MTQCSVEPRGVISHKTISFNYSTYSELPSVSAVRVMGLRTQHSYSQEADVSTVIVTSHIQILMAVRDVQLAVSGVVNSIKRLACQTASGTRDKVADLVSRCSFIAIINLSLTGVINSRGTTMKLRWWQWTFRDTLMVVQTVKTRPVAEPCFARTVPSGPYCILSSPRPNNSYSATTDADCHCKGLLTVCGHVDGSSAAVEQVRAEFYFHNVPTVSIMWLPIIFQCGYVKCSRLHKVDCSQLGICAVYSRDGVKYRLYASFNNIREWWRVSEKAGKVNRTTDFLLSSRHWDSIRVCM
jgi:hypothetical protein